MRGDKNEGPGVSRVSKVKKLLFRGDFEAKKAKNGFLRGVGASGD